MKRYLRIILLLPILFWLSGISEGFGQSSACATDPGDRSCENCSPFTGEKINSGATVCLTSSGTYTVNLEGGTLIICGSGIYNLDYALNGNYNGESVLYINSGATVNLNISKINIRIYNRGTLNITPTDDNKVTVNGSGFILNTGMLNINSTLQMDAGLTNMNRINVSGNFYLNGSSNVILSTGSIMKIMGTSTIDGGINGCGGCLHSVNQVKGDNYVRNQGLITPNTDLVYICAQGGFDHLFTVDSNGNGKSGGAYLQSGCTECSMTPPDINPDTLTVEVSGTLSVCAGESTQLTASASASGGSGNYNYTWEGISGNSATVTVSPNLTTTYRVTVTDNNNPQLTGNASVTVTTRPAEQCSGSLTVNLNIEGSQSVCAGESTRLRAHVSGGSGNYDYVWEGASENSALVTVNPVQTTTYRVTVTDRNNPQLTGSATVTVTVKPAAECLPPEPPKPPIPGTCATDPGDRSCENCSPFTDYNVNTGTTVCLTAPGTYSMNLGGGTLIVCGSGTYNLDYTLNGTYNGESTLYINSGATVNLNVAQINIKIYNRGTLNITPATDSKLTVNGSGFILNAGIFNVNSTLQLDARVTNMNRINVSGDLYLNGSSHVVLSTGSIMKINGTSTIDGGIYGCGGCLHSIGMVTGGNYVTNNRIITPTNELVYICAQRGFNGQFTVDAEGSGRSGGAYLQSECSDCGMMTPTDTLSVTLEIEGRQPACPGEQVKLTAGVSGGSGDYDYAWEGISGNSPTVTVNPVQTTSYRVTVTDRNNPQLKGSAVVTVQVQTEGCPGPIIIEGNPEICKDSTVTLTARMEGENNYIWEWQLNGVTVSGGARLTATLSETTVYTVLVKDLSGRVLHEKEVTVTVSEDCIESIEIEIEGGREICEGETAILTASVAGNHTYRFEWKRNGVLISNTARLTTTEPGTYTVFVKDGDKILKHEDVTITLKENCVNPVEIEGGGEICLGSSVTLTARVTVGDGAYTYEWTTDGGKTFSGSTITDTPESTTIYTVTVKENNVPAGQATITIPVKNCDPVPPPCVSNPGERLCDNCTTLEAGNSGSLNAGDYCITAPGSYTVDMNGANLIICGDGTYSLTLAGNINRGTITVNSGATVAINRISPDITLINKGKVTINSQVTVGNGRLIWNAGELEIRGELEISGTVENAGTVNVSNTLKLNSNGKLVLGGPSAMNVQSVTTLDAQIYGCLGGCLHSVEKINSANVISNMGKLTPDDHSVLICSQGGFGDIFGSSGRSGGAELQSGCEHCESSIVPPNVIIEGEPVICAGGSTTLTARAEGDATYTYYWKELDRYGSAIRLSPSVTTTYTLVVSDGTHSSTTTVTVTVLKAEISGHYNGQTTLTASEGDSYSWSTGQTSRSITVQTPTPEQGTQYYWVKMTKDGVTCTDTVALLAITIEGDQSICPGETTVLTAGVAGSGNYTCQWSGAGIVSVSGSSATVAPTETTEYTVVVTDEQTGISQSATATVTVGGAACDGPGPDPDPVPCGEPDLPDTAYDCSGCQSPSLNWDGTQIALNNAGRYCLTSSASFPRVEINHPDAILVICGSGTFNFGELHLNQGTLVIGQGASVTFNSPGVNYPNSNLYNRGNLTLSGMYGNPFTLNGGKVVNKGNMTVNGDLNPSNNNGGSFTNYGRVDVSNTFGPFNAGNVYLEAGSVINTRNIGEVHSGAILCSGCIRYTGTIGNITRDNFTDSNISVCRATGSGDTSKWGTAEVETGCDWCRMTVIPPKDQSVCDTLFQKGSQTIDLNIQVSAGSGGPYSYSWSAASGAGQAALILPQGGLLDPIRLQIPVYAAFPLTNNYVEEVTLTVTDPADNTTRTVIMKYTIRACSPAEPPCCVPDSICGGKVLFSVVAPTCYNNGKISLMPNSIIGEPEPICSAIWTGPGVDGVSATVLDGISAGKYAVQIDCGDRQCEAEINVPASEDKDGGLLATYYYTGETGETCLVALEQKESAIDLEAGALPVSVPSGSISSIRWTGFLQPPCDGEYTFYRETNAPGQLYIGVTPVADNTPVTLTGGQRYPIVYELDYTPGAYIKIEWQAPNECFYSERETIPSCFLIPHNLNGVVPPSPNGTCPGPGPGPDPDPCLNRPAIELPAVVDICEAGQSVRLEAIAYGTFFWSPGNETASSISVSSPGFYKVKVTDWFGCTGEKEVQVRSLSGAGAGATLVSSDPCTGRAELKAFGGGTYRWYPSDYLSNPSGAVTTASPLASTSYSAVIQTEGGCTVTKELYVEVKTPFELKIEGDTTGCFNSPVTLTANGADSYFWSPMDGLLCLNSDCSSVEYILITDQKTFTVTGLMNGCTRQEYVTVRTNITGSVAIGIDAENQDSENCSVPFMATPGFGRYTWNFGDGTEPVITDDNTVDHKYNLSGTYEVCVTLENRDCPDDIKEACQVITVKPEECQCEPCRNS
ncbi:MAG: PKD domain-containing protein [Prevotellaceae bacterium]|jgi:hypothetical protein|nr:PKD domain-containing protein [Prevotellaceae bacterium]